MYSSVEKQFVFKQEKGKIWNFYHDSRLGVCYSTLTGRNTWTNPISIHKNAQKPFYAEMDRDDCFHLLFQDNSGNIFYSRIINEVVETFPILTSKTPALYNKHLSLVPFKNNIHFFYILKHNDSNILSHQIFTAESPEVPRVIDYVHDNCLSYSVAWDDSSDIYVFYQIPDRKGFQIGHKKYIPLQRKWEEFIPVTDEDEDSEFPRVVVGPGNIMHICYQRRTAKQYELVYRQKIPGKNIWTDGIVIHTSSYSFDEASVLCIGNSIIVYWVRNDVIYYSVSHDGGSTWSKPARYNFPYGRQLFCISYRTNNPAEKNKVAVREFPGNFVNGLKIAFYDDVSEKTENLTANDLRNMIVDSLKLLKGSIEDLREANASLKADIVHLTLTQKEMEKEITKKLLKLDMLESRLNQLSQARQSGFQAEKCQDCEIHKMLPEILEIQRELKKMDQEFRREREKTKKLSAIDEQSDI